MVEAYNAGNLEGFVNLHAESVIEWSPDSPEPRKGRAALLQELQGYATAFPDSRIQKDRTFGHGDWVCGQFTFTGTHTGPLPGPGGQTVPATHKSLRMPYVVVYKFEGGEITERHQYFDLLGMMAQLGLAAAGD